MPTAEENYAEYQRLRNLAIESGKVPQQNIVVGNWLEAGFSKRFAEYGQGTLSRESLNQQTADYVASARESLTQYGVDFSQQPSISVSPAFVPSGYGSEGVSYPAQADSSFAIIQKGVQGPIRNQPQNAIAESQTGWIFLPTSQMASQTIGLGGGQAGVGSSSVVVSGPSRDSYVTTPFLDMTGWVSGKSPLETGFGLTEVSKPKETGGSSVGSLSMGFTGFGLTEVSKPKETGGSSVGSLSMGFTGFLPGGTSLEQFRGGETLATFETYTHTASGNAGLGIVSAASVKEVFVPGPNVDHKISYVSAGREERFYGTGREIINPIEISGGATRVFAAESVKDTTAFGQFYALGKPEAQVGFGLSQKFMEGFDKPFTGETSFLGGTSEFTRGVLISGAGYALGAVDIATEFMRNPLASRGEGQKRAAVLAVGGAVVYGGGIAYKTVKGDFSGAARDIGAGFVADGLFSLVGKSGTVFRAAGKEVFQIEKMEVGVEKGYITSYTKPVVLEEKLVFRESSRGLVVESPARTFVVEDVAGNKATFFELDVRAGNLVVESQHFDVGKSLLAGKAKYSIVDAKQVAGVGKIFGIEREGKTSYGFYDLTLFSQTEKGIVFERAQGQLKLAPSFELKGGKNILTSSGFYPVFEKSQVVSVGSFKPSMLGREFEFFGRSTSETSGGGGLMQFFNLKTAGKATDFMVSTDAQGVAKVLGGKNLFGRFVGFKDLVLGKASVRGVSLPKSGGQPIALAGTVKLLIEGLREAPKSISFKGMRGGNPLEAGEGGVSFTSLSETVFPKGGRENIVSFEVPSKGGGVKSVMKGLQQTNVGMSQSAGRGAGSLAFMKGISESKFFEAPSGRTQSIPAIVQASGKLSERSFSLGEMLNVGKLSRVSYGPMARGVQFSFERGALARGVQEQLRGETLSRTIGSLRAVEIGRYGTLELMRGETLFRTETMGRTALLSRTSVFGGPLPGFSFPPIPIGGGFNFGGGAGGYHISSDSGLGRSFSYKADLTSIIGNIRGKALKGILTGVELRPIPILRSSRKRSKTNKRGR